LLDALDAGSENVNFGCTSNMRVLAKTQVTQFANCIALAREMTRRFATVVDVKLNFQLRLRCACAATAMRERCDFIAEQSQTQFPIATAMRVRGCDGRAMLR
jgi:hypothetical protein